MDIGDVPVAILAGGLATRLRPITESIPKILVKVAGKPFLEHQLELLRHQGIRRVVLCLGYLGETVQQQYGDGSSCGMHLEYSFDGPKLLGTGGALKSALPMLGDTFFVLYGDSYLPIDFAPIATFFEQSQKSGLMTVYRNQGLYDTSNVLYRDGRILLYNKSNLLPEMQHIDYGLSLFNSSAFATQPNNESFDLSSVLQSLLKENDLAACEVPDRFYEIGSHAGLAELETLLAARNG